MDEYENITKLEKIIELSKSKIVEPYQMNFHIKVQFDISLIQHGLKDVNALALSFQEPKCPETLQINHGEYIHKKENGIDNVIKELEKKDTSNRAIISLINQEDIVGSGDKPIPSFMILQFSIEDNNTLYVTAYFRALEVSTFLRINIEEIRIIIEKIKTAIIKIEKIKLNIISFRAYIDEGTNTLERAKLDLLSSAKIFGILKQNTPEEIIKLLEEKAKSSTVIEYKSFETILEWMDDPDSKDNINTKIIKPLVKSLFSSLIDISKKIENLRIKSSHSNDIKAEQIKFTEKIDNLIKEIRNDS